MTSLANIHQHTCPLNFAGLVLMHIVCEIKNAVHVEVWENIAHDTLIILLET